MKWGSVGGEGAESKSVCKFIWGCHHDIYWRPLQGHAIAEFQGDFSHNLCLLIHFYSISSVLQECPSAHPAVQDLTLPLQVFERFYGTSKRGLGRVWAIWSMALRSVIMESQQDLI